MRVVPTPRSSVAAAIAALALLLAHAAAVTAEPRPSSVAVFPVENLSATRVPLDGIRHFFEESLAARGVRVLDPRALDAFMQRHRVRYAAGVDGPTGEALRQESGVDGIVFVTVTQSNELPPPKVALIARLVSLEGTPTVVWAGDVALAGDEAPGLFERGLVHDYDALVGRALRRVGAALADYLLTGATEDGPSPSSKFRPKVAYRAHSLEPGRTYTVAVLPFHNASARRNGGEIVSLLFARHLSSLPNLRVLDIGVVRREMLSARIIMDGGPAITDAETVASLLDADFVLGGRVLEYHDDEGAEGNPRVEFSTVLFSRGSRRVVWASDSYADGGEGVRFFNRGRSRTAQAMATQMARLAAEMIGRGRER